MRPKRGNVLVAVAAVLLFSFSCFCISRLTQTSNQLINCRNHILEFKEKMLRLKNKTERNRQELIKALSKIKYEMTQRKNMPVNLVEKKVNTLGDRNEDYLKYVVDMITKRFKRQLKSGSLESWRIKQVLDFCFLMLYAQPKAKYYLQLEDDIIAKKMYFTKITDFVHSGTSNNWFYIEFSILGFIGKLFKSEDLTDFVRFFLMFYKDKPIDLLLGDIFQVKMCDPGETPQIEKCAERNKHIRIRYKPSLFQHVGIQSSFPGREQYSKENMKNNKCNKKKTL
ncbi:Alpha-1,3-mannosyl-glycoprotein 4-beta-N-acetylglucosaminyltransferase-like protein MGAT4D [Vulpes lagopus]